MRVASSPIKNVTDLTEITQLSDVFDFEFSTSFIILFFTSDETSYENILIANLVRHCNLRGQSSLVGIIHLLFGL